MASICKADLQCHDWCDEVSRRPLHKIVGLRRVHLKALAVVFDQIMKKIEVSVDGLDYTAGGAGMKRKYRLRPRKRSDEAHASEKLSAPIMPQYQHSEGRGR